MQQKSVPQVARLLKLLVTITFICNLIVLPLVPTLTTAGQNWSSIYDLIMYLSETFPPWSALCAPVICFVLLFTQPDYVIVLTLFLWFCGCCTAVILWQARRVLNNLIAKDLFCRDNAGNMRRAGLCCFLISSAALCRMVWGVCYYRSPSPLFTYNALFIPVFLMGGLLSLVMSALFRQAAELKEENDLTI